MTDPISTQITINARRGGYEQPGGRLIMTMADHIDAQAATIKALVDAFERIASRHVTKSPLWWQVEARTALAAAKQPT